MAASVFRTIIRWISDHVLWDASGPARTGFWRALWALRKVSIAVVGSAILTRQEWVEHHPPEIAVVALLHFVFVLAAIALLVFAGQKFRRARQSKPR